MFELILMLLGIGLLVVGIREWLERTDFAPHEAFEELDAAQWEDTQLTQADQDYLQTLERDELHRRHIALEIELMRDK